MQILYGEDTSGDGTPNYYVDADTVANMDEVVSVRITLIARTADSNLSSSGDGRLRRTFSSTLVLRNRLQ
jgi:type IV pilus assembly protein PilW